MSFAPGAVDGLHGKRSRSAVAEFRQVNGLRDGDRVLAHGVAVPLESGALRGVDIASGLPQHGHDDHPRITEIY